MNGGILISIVVFGYHYAMGREFDYSSSLSAFSMMNYLSLTSIYFLYSAIITFSSFISTMFRIGEIMKLEEYESKNNFDDELPKDIRIQIENCSVSWGIQNDKNIEANLNSKPSSCLRNLNLSVSKNELIAIIGPVGCGKSSFLSAIMKELDIIEGTIKTAGRKAYVEQEPFITSGSIRDNILMGSVFSEQRFEQVIKACCLTQDIDRLPLGVDTEIGERGITVSGGQRSRISLARAVYSDADIYLLDDPLSAVDPEVAENLYNSCINGFLKHKCRILVTHQVQYLKRLKHIVYVDNGCIKHEGSYSSLSENGLDFDKIFSRQKTKPIKNDDQSVSSCKSFNFYEVSIDDSEEESIANIILDKIDDNSKDESNELHLDIKKTSYTIINAENKTIDFIMPKNKRKTSGIVIQEVKKSGFIKLKDWYQFFSFGAGIKGILIIFILSINVSALVLLLSYTIGEWSSQSKTGQQNSKYFIIYLFIGILILFLSFLRCIIIALSCITSSQNIHADMVWKILRAPVIFFDSNPIGTILTRFSTDIMTTDFILPRDLDMLLISGFKVIVTTIFLCVTIPFNCISVILIFIPMYCVRRYQRLAQSDCQRIEAISKGPLNTRFSSVLDGIQTIRVYNKQKFFTENFMADSDLNIAARFTLSGVTRWFVVRLDICALCFILISMISIVIIKGETSILSPFMASLTIQFGIDFSYNLSFAIRMIGKIENMLVSSQRMIDYTKMESEDELIKSKDNINWTKHPDVKFENVSMRYRSHLPPVLKGVQRLHLKYLI